MPLWYNQCNYACSHPCLQLIDCWIALLVSLLDSILPAVWIWRAIDIDKPLTLSFHLLQPAGSHGHTRGGWRVCSPDTASLPAGCVPLPERLCPHSSPWWNSSNCSLPAPHPSPRIFCSYLLSLWLQTHWITLSCVNCLLSAGSLTKTFLVFSYYCISVGTT